MSRSFFSDSPQASLVQSLLLSARQGDEHQLGKLLQLYRNYLTILATKQLGTRLQRRLSPADLVQEVMLGAFRDFAQFRGESEPEFLGWLRKILVHRRQHAYEIHIKARRRDLRREVSLDDLSKTLLRSVVRTCTDTSLDAASPTSILSNDEQATAVTAALARLKTDYRDVIVLRVLQGLSFPEVAKRMDRKPGTVRMLWLRAIKRFRQLYENVL